MLATELIYYSRSLQNLVVIKKSQLGRFLITEFGTDLLKDVDIIKDSLKLELIDVQLIKDEYENQNIHTV